MTVVVNDRSTESGSILVRGERMFLDLKTPDPRTILRTGDNLFIYEPGLKRVEEFNLGKNRGLVDQFLLLGFGTGGKELRKGYGITLVSEATVDDRKTVELELIPKSEDQDHEKCALAEPRVQGPQRAGENEEVAGFDSQEKNPAPRVGTGLSMSEMIGLLLRGSAK